MVLKTALHFLQMVKDQLVTDKKMTTKQSDVAIIMGSQSDWETMKNAVEIFKIIIAGAGGAAHLPGMAASMTPLPVLGVPVQSKALSGQDSLLSIVQMPAGIPVGTLAIGTPGAKNAALFAASILALNDEALAKRLDAYRSAQTESVALKPVDGE